MLPQMTGPTASCPAPQPEAMKEEEKPSKMPRLDRDLLKRVNAKGFVGEQRDIVPRQMRHALYAYTYGLVIGIGCSFLIAATAVNFGPEKTLEWLTATGLSLVWRLFSEYRLSSAHCNMFGREVSDTLLVTTVIEPMKVLFCGGFEGVAGLITGEADSWCVLL